MIVYVEKKVLEDPAIVGDDSFGPVKKKFCTFREGELPQGSVPGAGAGGRDTVPVVPQTTTTFPTRSISSSAWAGTAPCSTPPRSSR